MGEVFDNFIGKSKNPIQKYLMDRGFEEGTMNPRFMNGFKYDNLTIDKKCLCCYIPLHDGRSLSIFINDIDIYYEVETSYRSYDSSNRYDSKEYTDVEIISVLLDKIVEIVGI